MYYETIGANRYFFEFEIPSVLVIQKKNKKRKNNQKLTQIELRK